MRISFSDNEISLLKDAVILYQKYYLSDVYVTDTHFESEKVTKYKKELEQRCNNILSKVKRRCVSTGECRQLHLPAESTTAGVMRRH